MGTLIKLGYKAGTAPIPAQIADAASAMQQLNQPQFQAALQRISA